MIEGLGKSEAFGAIIEAAELERQKLAHMTKNEPGPGVAVEDLAKDQSKGVSARGRLKSPGGPR